MPGWKLLSVLIPSLWLTHMWIPSISIWYCCQTVYECWCGHLYVCFLHYCVRALTLFHPFMHYWPKNAGLTFIHPGVVPGSPFNWFFLNFSLSIFRNLFPQFFPGVVSGSPLSHHLPDFCSQIVPFNLEEEKLSPTFLQVWCQALHSLTTYLMLTTYSWMLCEGAYLRFILVNSPEPSNCKHWYDWKIA